MNVFAKKIENKTIEQIETNIYLSTERAMDAIGAIQANSAFEVEQFKAIYRLIFTFMMASTSLLPGTLISKEQNSSFMKVADIFNKRNHPYPLQSKESIKTLFDSEQAVAMINNATINTKIKEHGVKELWDIFRMSVLDFEEFCFDYLNVAYSLTILKDFTDDDVNKDMFNAIEKNLNKEFNISFSEEDLEKFEFRTDPEVA